MIEENIMDEIEQVNGNQIELPGGRCVFLSHPPGVYYIEFRSTEGSITRYSLSEEAMHALCVLSSTPLGHRFEIKKATRRRIEGGRWQIVPEQEA